MARFPEESSGHGIRQRTPTVQPVSRIKLESRWPGSAFGDLHGHLQVKLLVVIGTGPALQHQALALDDDPEIIDPPTQPPVDLRLDLLDDPGATVPAAL